MDNHADGHTRTLRILVAEDEVMIAMTFELVLADRGHQVDITSDGQEALEHITQLGAPDALITDLRMPRMNGDELICRVRKLHPNLPVLVVSATTNLELLETLRGLGGPVSFMAKPASIDRVADEVERLAANGGNRRDGPGNWPHFAAHPPR